MMRTYGNTRTQPVAGPHTSHNPRTLGRGIATLGLCLSIAACGGSGDGGSAAAPNQAAGGGQAQQPADDAPVTASFLSGSWVACVSTTRTAFTFSGDEWSEERTQHRTLDCTGAPLDDGIAFAGTFEFVGETTSNEGLSVQRIDLIQDELVGFAIEPMTHEQIIYSDQEGQFFLGVLDGTEGRPTQIEFNRAYLRQ